MGVVFFLVEDYKSMEQSVEVVVLGEARRLGVLDRLEIVIAESGEQARELLPKVVERGLPVFCLLDATESGDDFDLVSTLRSALGDKLKYLLLYSTEEVVMDEGFLKLFPKLRPVPQFGLKDANFFIKEDGVFLTPLRAFLSGQLPAKAA